LVVVGFLLSTVPHALAGETGKATDPERAAALAHFETANRLFDVREYSKALEEYKAAYLVKPDPAFLFNIGQCHRKLGQNPQALDFYQQYLKKVPADDPNRPLVEARIADIQAEDRAKTAPAPVPVVPVAPAPLPIAAEPSTPAAGTDLSLGVQSEPAAQSKPIYSRWWFWAGVGAVVVAGAATTVLLLSSKGGTTIPSTTMGNRPVFP
jgi:tetratricopeptide (TPR) repeat protein